MSNELIVQENNVSVLARVEIDTRIATARQYPRDVTRAIEQAIALATINEDIAASCGYALPRKDKDKNNILVTGKTIRLAEIILSVWGNIDASARIVEVGEKHITTEGVCFNLETNTKVTMPDRVSIWFGEKNGNKGYRANNDMQVMLAKASCAKALRNAVFKSVGESFVNIVYEAAMKKAIGESKSLSTKVTTVVNKLVKMGLNKEQILEYFGHTKTDDFTAEDLQSLIGIGTALKEGMIKPEEVFLMEKTDEESASDKLNELIASKNTPKLSESVDSVTGEVLDNDLPY